jgi:hypothetical protein
MNVHSYVLAPHLKEAQAAGAGGKYGRMFPDLPRHDADDSALLALGRAGSSLDADGKLDTAGKRSDNPRIPAGFTYIGQFIAHDIAADRSLLQHHANLNELSNARAPRLNRLDPERPPQPGKRIDTLLVHALIDLPLAVVGVTEIPEYRALAVRDLQRARALDLPSGEEVARAMGVTPLTAEQCGLQANGWRGDTPLWYDILKEAEVLNDGQRLGPVGGRIVAEVLLGILAADPVGYLSVDREWKPVLPAVEPGDFTMADLLRFAGAV